MSLKVDAYQRGRWILAANYRLVRYTDAFRLWIRPSLLLHKEYRQDEVIVDLPDFDRGYLVQSGDGDFRPRELFHSFAAMAGYEIWDTKYFRAVAYAGLHFSSNRVYTYNWSQRGPETFIILEEGDEPIVIDYNDYTIYREWDVGPDFRVDFDYKLCGNIWIGVNSMIGMDLIDQSIDLTWGGGLTFVFND